MVVDLDFRYVERDKEVSAGAGCTPLIISAKVLQWRKNVSCYGEEWTEWTEWQDVRTEEE